MGDERIRLKVGGRTFVVARSTGEAVQAKLAAGELKTMEDVEAELLRLESARKPRHVDYAVRTAAGVGAAIRNGTFRGWHSHVQVDELLKARGVVRKGEGQGYDFSALVKKGARNVSEKDTPELEDATNAADAGGIDRQSKAILKPIEDHIKGDDSARARDAIDPTGAHKLSSRTTGEAGEILGGLTAADQAGGG